MAAHYGTRAVVRVRVRVKGVRQGMWYVPS